MAAEELVLRKLSLEEALRNYVTTSTGCWEWQGSRHARGYGRIGSRVAGVRAAHRAMWILKHGEIPNGMLVCHRCDNPPCINPDHLFLGTDLDNAKDRQAKRRGRNGLKGKNFLTLNGETMNMFQWSKRTGLSCQTIWYRKKSGLSDEEALTRQVK